MEENVSLTEDMAEELDAFVSELQETRPESIKRLILLGVSSTYLSLSLDAIVGDEADHNEHRKYMALSHDLLSAAFYSEDEQYQLGGQYGSVLLSAIKELVRHEAGVEILQAATGHNHEVKTPQEPQESAIPNYVTLAPQPESEQ